MTQVRGLLALALALALGAAFIAEAQAQQRGGSRRGLSSRSSLVGLLAREEVQKELKLNEEQTAKVRAVVEKIGTEITGQFAALREIDDREKQQAKMTELSDQADQNVREQLGDVLARDQFMRLYQIRMQYRAVVDSLSNRYVGGRLEITEVQKTKLAQIGKDVQAKRAEVLSAMANASQEQRREAFGKLREIQTAADEEALGVLTAEQKDAFEDMKGEKFELQSRRGRRSTG